MPSQNIFPALRYVDCDHALSWLKAAFGFEEKAVYRGDDGAIHHAELRFGDGVIMLGPDNGTDAQPGGRGGATQSMSPFLIPTSTTRARRRRERRSHARSPISRTAHANTAPATSKATRGRSAHTTRMTPEDARQLALALSEAVEQDQHGRPSFRVGGRIFATLWDEHTMNVMLDEPGIRTAIERHPEWCAPRL